MVGLRRRGRRPAGSAGGSGRRGAPGGPGSWARGRSERRPGGGAGQRRCGMGRWAGPGEGRAVRTGWGRGVAERRRGQD